MDPRQQYDALINAILKAAGSARLDQYMPYYQDRMRQAAQDAFHALSKASPSEGGEA